MKDWREKFKKLFTTKVFYGQDQEKQAIDCFIKFIEQLLQEQREDIEVNQYFATIDELEKNLKIMISNLRGES